jgi:hypothetical protein
MEEVPVILNQAERLEKLDPRNANPNAYQQQLPFFDLPLDKKVPALVRPVKPNGERYLQDCLWKESLLAVKLSLDCESVAELITRLREYLPQNSVETRERNTSIILSRFFPTNEIDQLPRRVLRACDDETLLASVMRVLFLEAEPLVGRLVTERLFPLPPGMALAKDFFSAYAQEATGRRDRHIASRCKAAVRALGWVIEEKRRCYVAQQTINETAALLIFHHYYAPTPRIIDMKLLLAEPTWKYLGFSSEDTVRGFMRKLEQRSLVSRYAVVDRLEQVTTRYSLDSLIERKIQV